MERFETKYDLLNRVYADTRLKRTTKSLMQYLVAKSDDKSCHPSVATIAAAIRMSERTVQRHMRELEKYHYLVCRKRFYRNEQLTNQYEFVLDVMDTSDTNMRPSADLGIDYKKYMEDHEAEKQNLSKIKYIKYISESRLSNKECLVLIYFVHKANQNGIAYSNIKKVSKELHMSARLLWKTILELRAKQYLLLKSNAGKIIVKLTEPDPEGEKREVEKEKLYPELENVYSEYAFGEAESSAKVSHEKKKGFILLGIEKICQTLIHCLRDGYVQLKKILRHFLL